jgi:hypothetical protein
MAAQYMCLNTLPSDYRNNTMSTRYCAAVSPVSRGLPDNQFMRNTVPPLFTPLASPTANAAVAAVTRNQPEPIATLTTKEN